MLLGVVFELVLASVALATRVTDVGPLSGVGADVPVPLEPVGETSPINQPKKVHNKHYNHYIKFGLKKSISKS